MCDEKIVFPKDVELRLADRPVYEIPAQYNELCTHTHCVTEGCKGATKRGYIYCSACRERMRRKRLDSYPAWDGSYPVFAGCRLLNSREDLDDYLEGNAITDLSSVVLFVAEPRYACEIDVNYEDLLMEGDELPTKVQDIIDEFSRKLSAVKEPIAYRCGTCMRFSKDQMDILYLDYEQPERW